MNSLAYALIGLVGCLLFLGWLIIAAESDCERERVD